MSTSMHVAMLEKSNRRLVARRIPDASPPLIVNLSGRDVPVVEQILHGLNRHA